MYIRKNALLLTCLKERMPQGATFFNQSLIFLKSIIVGYKTHTIWETNYLKSIRAWNLWQAPQARIFLFSLPFSENTHHSRETVRSTFSPFPGSLQKSCRNIVNRLQGHKKNASTFKEKEFGLFLQTSKRFLKSSRAFWKPCRDDCMKSSHWLVNAKKNDCTMGLQRPHDWAATTARLGRNDRTIGPQRPLDSLALTSQCKSNERSIRPQRPHDSGSTTARFRLNERSISWKRAHVATALKASH